MIDWERHARTTPNAVALLSPGRENLTYARLSKLTESFREKLLHAGLIPGQAIAMVLDNGPDFVTTVLAASSLGACAPFNPALSEDEFESFFTRLRAPVLLTKAGFGTAAVPAARRLGMSIVEVHYCEDFGVESVKSDGPSRIADPRSIDATLLLFTSATTGRSKLIPLTAANLTTQWANDTRAYGFTNRDVYLNLVPLFNLFGIGAILLQLSCGGSAVCLREFDPLHLGAWIEQYRPTWISLNPVWHQTLQMLVRQSPQLWHSSGLRFIRSGGSPQDPARVRDLEEAMGVAILEAYGMTETGGITRSTPTVRRDGSAGRTTGTEIEIRDGAGNALPYGEEGEIVVRGPNITSGYLDDPEANREAFADGWFRTGDFGKFDADGFLFITGRLKEIINRAGTKIIPQEVDRIILEHRDVADAAVFPIPHRALGDEIAAAVVLKPGATSLTERDLRRFVSQHAAPFKVPRHVVFVDDLPRGATGRLQRKKLSERFQDLAVHTSEKRLTTTGPEVASQLMAARLIEVWQRILKVPEISLNDSFYDLGGDSLSAALMLEEVRKEFSLGPAFLDAVEFFDKPTVETLAQLLAATDSTVMPAEEGCRVLSLNPAGSLQPVFCFPASDADPYYFRHLAKALGAEQPCFIVCPPPPTEGRKLLSVEESAQRAIRVVRARQPEGPYRLIGHCYGGVIAVEMTRQLGMEKQDITSLILLDSLTPGYPKIAASAGKYVQHGLEAGRAAIRGRVLFSTQDVIAHLRRLGFLAGRKVAARWRRAKVVRGDAASIDPSNGQLLLNRTALAEYTLPEVHIPMVHFMAKDQKVDSLVLEDPRFGWRDFARAGLEERWVAGDHNSLLMNENAPGLAAEIEFVLNPKAATAP